MFELTPRAQAALVHSRAESGLSDEFAVRISGSGSRNGSEAGYKVRFASHPSPDDVVVESGGTMVFLASDVAEPLQEAVLDAQDTPQGSQLVLKRRR